MKIITTILVALLSTTFVMRTEYEEKINELELRIEQLESQEDTLLNEVIKLSSEHYNITVTLENGYIVESIVCANFNDECESVVIEENGIYYTSDKPQLLEDIQNGLKAYDTLYDMFN